MRAFLLVALLAGLGGWPSCAPSTGQPPPVPTTSVPPVHADAGAPCATSCDAAAKLCDRPVMSVAECATRCTQSMENLSGPTATPRCFAAILICNSKEWCPR